MNRNVFVHALISLCLLCVGSGWCAETGKKILVLPFAINAGPDQDYLSESLPTLLGDKLRALGLDVVPVHTVDALLQDREVEVSGFARSARFGRTGRCTVRCIWKF